VATSINCGCPAWVDDVTQSAQTPWRQFEVGTKVLNLGTASANQVPSGVFPGLGAMQVSAGSGMAATVAAGYCCVANSSSSLQGGYIFGLMTSASLTVAAADPVNPRLDIIVAFVADNGDSSSFSAVEIITGTPASPPVAPAAPANSLTLASITIPANVVSVASGTITDLRAYVVAPGGILPIATASAAPAVPASQFMITLDTNQLVQGTGTAGSVSVPSVLKWAPQLATVTSTVHAASSGALTTVASVSVTTDGLTDIEVYCKWPGVVGHSGFVTIMATIDGSAVDDAAVVSTDGTQPTAGGSLRYFTSSGQGNTPSNGTHTIAFKFQAGGGSTSTSDGVYAASGAVAQLRVAPVVT
jgi:hypothetical protein